MREKMNGHQIERTCENCLAYHSCTKRFKKWVKVCDQYIEIPRMPPVTPPKIKPIDDKKDTAALVEQLNGLLVNYREVFVAYQKIMFTENDKITESVCGVLENIEKAVDAICLRLTHNQFIVNPESNTTQQI